MSHKTSRRKTKKIRLYSQTKASFKPGRLIYSNAVGIFFAMLCHCFLQKTHWTSEFLYCMMMKQPCASTAAVTEERDEVQKLLREHRWTVSLAFLSWYLKSLWHERAVCESYGHMMWIDSRCLIKEGKTLLSAGKVIYVPPGQRVESSVRHPLKTKRNKKNQQQHNCSVSSSGS